MTDNPRRRNGSRRDKARAWVLATQDVCGICGQYIDKDIKTPHPMSPEVDEIVPVSKGGSPYSRDNLQLTHRICNQRKGNRIVVAKEKLEAPLKTSRRW